MAIYRNIHITFWSDTKVVDDFTPEDKYFMLYCLTNNYTNLCGCYEISIKQMCRDLGYNEETVRNLLKRFENIHKIISYDEYTKELFVKNWYKYNWTKSEKLDKPLLNEIQNIKSKEFRNCLIDLYNKRDTVCIPYIYPMDTTDTDTDTVSDIKDKNEEIKNNKKAFIKPSVEEINAYCLERNNNIDGQHFYDFYESKGWMVGKNKMKDWKACVRTWENSSKQQPSLKNACHDTQFEDLSKFYV